MIQGWMLRWVLNILALILTAAILPGFQLTIWAAILGSLFLGVINAIIRPLLLILTLPLNVITLGLFTFVINGFMLWITSITIRGFDINGFGWAIVSALLFSLISFVISYFVEDRNFNWR
ncbi:MAG: phage holin family protein [Syntrophomonadaceae bacterium]|nr:phage holin family protein [Syntrophomonadaceae bacterium]MDD3889282.1 phage holin family protein [Syntrophomonadaceae bacterium]MDD4549788.1 phage holin family protein [Syntrophomonadaceae bacterium]